MKIVQIGNHFFPCTGGIEKIMLDLCNQLNKKNIQSDVICLNTCANSSKKLEFEEKINRINVKRLDYLDLRLYKIAPEVLNQVKEFDVVHVHGLGFFADFLSATKFLHKKKLILSTHGGLWHTKNFSALKKLYWQFEKSLFLHNIDFVVAVSKQDFEKFSQIVPKEKLVLIENGVMIEDFLDNKPDLKSKNFIYWGRISKNKRIDLLLETFAQVLKKEKNSKLFIIGEDWEGIVSNLKQKAKSLGIEKSVEFTGMLAEKERKKLINNSGFFVSASEYEGFGITTYEAMAAGLIPIVNDIEAFQGVKGKGFIVDFKQKDSASSEICAIINKNSAELNRLSNNAREYSKQFSWEKKIEEFIKIYEQAVKA
ncbi:MAG: glycosyltransferase family 4 protein [archaeon]|nr:glycosyltransferase family 4 protein [archaeon]